jgi:hypothetical protein
MKAFHYFGMRQGKAWIAATGGGVIQCLVKAFYIGDPFFAIETDGIVFATVFQLTAQARSYFHGECP